MEVDFRTSGELGKHSITELHLKSQETTPFLRKSHVSQAGLELPMKSKMTDPLASDSGVWELLKPRVFCILGKHCINYTIPPGSSIPRVQGSN